MGPQCSSAVLKKGTASPSRGLSQNHSCSHMQELLAHSFPNKWIQQEAAHPTHMNPLLDETQNYCSQCKRSPFRPACSIARVRTSGETGRERRGGHTHEGHTDKPSRACTARRLTVSQLRRVANETRAVGWVWGGGSFLPMMGASRKMSDKRLFTGS